MKDKQIKEINEETKKAIQRIENIWKKYDELREKYKAKEQECNRLKEKIEYVFSDASPNFDCFCDICVAKDSCNQNCCFEQIKELIYEVK